MPETFDQNGKLTPAGARAVIEAGGGVLIPGGDHPVVTDVNKLPEHLREQPEPQADQPPKPRPVGKTAGKDRRLAEGTPLPDDFPCRDELAAEGVTTVEHLRAIARLTDIKGIGDARAAEIEAALDRL